MRRAALLVLIVCLVATPALAAMCHSVLDRGSPEAGLFGGNPIPVALAGSSSRMTDYRPVTVRAAGAITERPGIAGAPVEVAPGRTPQPPRSLLQAVLHI